MEKLSSADDSSLECLEALLTFKNIVTRRSSSSPHIHPEIPVPDPLNPLLPHVIEGDYTPMIGTDDPSYSARPQMPMLDLSTSSYSVPNPLSSPTSSLEHASTSRLLMKHTNATEQKFVHTTADTSSDTKAQIISSTSVLRNEKIQAALNSRPQRGKKRRNLNDQERLELTRTRNREHAKCTRMKKKARHLELLEIEKMYLAMKAQQDLDTRRKTRLVKIIEGVSKADDQQGVKPCPHVNRLRSLVAEKLQLVQISFFGSTPAVEVATSASHTATIKVSVSGTDYASGESKTMIAFCYADYEATSSEISSLSLHWVEQECHQCKISPSISALSFET